MLSTHSRLATRAQIETMAANTLDYEPTRDDVVISLTTVPTRLDTLHAVLNSILHQSVTGVPIELHIASSVLCGTVWPELPSWLTAKRAVRVVRHHQDIGPAMKFLPSLCQHKDRAIIVVDDDVLYPADLVERLLRADARLDGGAAVCMRGWRIHSDLSWQKSFLTTPIAGTALDVGIICGHGGYCVRSRHFDLDMLADLQRAPECSWMMDDVWISAHLSQCGIRKRVIEGSIRLKIPIVPALGGNRAIRNDCALKFFAAGWRETDLEQQ